MILQQGDPMVVIRQTDHAFLAGFFAREWGNETFTKPEPFASFCLAVAEHDNGWQEWELQPGVDLLHALVKDHFAELQPRVVRACTTGRPPSECAVRT